MGTTDRERDLMAGIDGVVLDQPGASLPFTARLARDNGWSRAYAERVVAEYRRFVFLAAVAGHPVTPSDDVDQAWHLHLVYTRSYWDELCGEVLGFALHHGPTVGGPAEGAKFTDWYQRTRESYRRLFDAEPPADIWPPPRQRFANADRFRRVNTAEHWVLPKPTLARPGEARRPLTTASIAVLAALVSTGCLAAASVGSGPGVTAASLLGTSFLSGLLVVVVYGLVGLVIAMVVWGVYRMITRSGSGNRRASGRSHGGAAACGAVYFAGGDDDDDEGDEGRGFWSWFGGGDSGGNEDSGGGDSGCGGGGCGGCGA